VVSRFLLVRSFVALGALTAGALTLLAPLAWADKSRTIVFPGNDAAAALRPDGGSIGRDPPDPPPVKSRKQWVFDLRWSKGEPYLLGVHAIDLGAPQETPRAMGRFALELLEGPALVERVRFDFPLLGADEPADGGFFAPPTLGAKLSTRIGVMFPAVSRGTRLELLDRATNRRWPLPWPPPEEDAGTR
jgi:hypothetical protein